MKLLCFIMCASVSGLLVACGGHDTQQDNPYYLKGVAFHVQAVAGAPISAKCRNGSASTTTQEDGKFSLALHQLELPCMVELSVDGGKQKLHALSMQGEAVNVTALTELLVTRVLRIDLTDFYTHFNAELISKKVSPAGINTAEEEVKQALQNVLKLSMLSDFHHILLNQPVTDPSAYFELPKTVTYADKLSAIKQELTAPQFTQILTLLRQEPEIKTLGLRVDAQLLAAAKQTWQAANFQNYHYSYAYSCECLPTSPITIVVRNGIVSEAYTRNGHLPIDRGVNDKNITSINNLFGFVDQAYVKQAALVKFTRDSQYGYLKNLYVDYYANMADEELSVQVFDFAID